MVVVSPLISLMRDQVRGLESVGVRACFLGSAQTDATVEPGSLRTRCIASAVWPAALRLPPADVVRRSRSRPRCGVAALAGAYDVVYVCPETIQRLIPALGNLHRTVGIRLFAVDEAHCVSK